MHNSCSRRVTPLRSIEQQYAERRRLALTPTARRYPWLLLLMADAFGPAARRVEASGA